MKQRAGGWMTFAIRLFPTRKMVLILTLPYMARTEGTRSSARVGTTKSWRPFTTANSAPSSIPPNFAVKDRGVLNRFKKRRRPYETAVFMKLFTLMPENSSTSILPRTQSNSTSFLKDCYRILTRNQNMIESTEVIICDGCLNLHATICSRTNFNDSKSKLGGKLLTSAFPPVVSTGGYSKSSRKSWAKKTTWPPGTELYTEKKFKDLFKLLYTAEAKLVAVFMKDLCEYLFEKNRTLEDTIRDADELLADTSTDEDEDSGAGVAVACSTISDAGEASSYDEDEDSDYDSGGSEHDSTTSGSDDYSFDTDDYSFDTSSSSEDDLSYDGNFGLLFSDSESDVDGGLLSSDSESEADGELEESDDMMMDWDSL
mmetsp:Transcript_10658/g.23088  ORF Transcript_10658/g.23088 Transcript_10658/m.23088 type:complete len:371 (+) Transcript_10658:1427-2539(+)